MLTNIIAAVAVAIATNVVTTDNAVYAPDYSTTFDTWPTQWGQRVVVPATERYLTTNVVENITVTMEVNGVPRTFFDERTLSSVTAIQKLRQEWEPSGVKTNSASTQISNGAIFIGPGLTNITFSSKFIVVTNQ